MELREMEGALPFNVTVTNAAQVVLIRKNCPHLQTLYRAC
jgi:hypothetical protein